MPVGKTIRCVHSSTAKTPQSSHLWGVFIPFWRGGLDLRLATSCYFPSSHLQMQQLITPATIETSKLMNKSCIRLHLLPAGGAQQNYVITLHIFLQSDFSSEQNAFPSCWSCASIYTQAFLGLICLDCIYCIGSAFSINGQVLSVLPFESITFQ